MTFQSETRRAGGAAGLLNRSCLAADGSENTKQGAFFCAICTKLFAGYVRFLTLSGEQLLMAAILIVEGRQ
jgi:hypothetical protein